MTIASFLFVIAALFLGACYFFRHVANGVDTDEELEKENKTTPAGSVAQKVGEPVGGAITLTPEQLSALIESRVRSMLVMQQTDRQKFTLSSVGTSTVTHADATKKEPQIAQSMPKAHILGAGSEVSHVSFKAPQPLFNQIPEVWFEILEQQFQVAGITKESTKYLHSISALYARLHNQFASLIIREKGDQPYSVFKQEVIKGLGESEKTKLNNLLRGLTLGDRKPSQLLELFRRDAGTRFGDDSIRHLWLQRLPQQIQIVLTPFENDLPLSVLAERADNLIETLTQAQIHSVASSTGVSTETNQSNSPSLNAILAQVVTVLGEVSAVMAANGRSRSRLLIQEYNTKRKFLIDTGADVSVIPPNLSKNLSEISQFNLYAANGMQIKAFLTQPLQLDIGLRRNFHWNFIVAEVSMPIIGADFLQSTGLVVSIKRRRIIDPLTSLFTVGSITMIQVPALSVVDKTVVHAEVIELLSKFNTVSHESLSSSEVKHNVTHCLRTRGPPVSCRTRRLAPDKLDIAKKHFQNMMAQGICRPSKSSWANPLHLVPQKNGE